MSKFWDGVLGCKHEWSKDYYVWVSGCTCGNANESHCKKCGVYITTDPCGENSGASGWAHKRRRAERANR